jgi:hypothetical protein
MISRMYPSSYVLHLQIELTCSSRGVVHDRLVQLFQLQDELYASGARNFLFLNVPPFDRSPGKNIRSALRFCSAKNKLIFLKGGNYSTAVKEQIDLWNSALPGFAANFTSTDSNITVFLFDTQALWDEFYEDSAAFNITDPDIVGGGLWYDDYHPSTSIQEVIGQRVADFLVAH